MYNKLFTKILDSSIWTAPTPTRIVWLTFIAAMDEDGFVPFASVKNVAHRAIVSLEEAEAAIVCLESPDKDSSDPDNEGRRILRVDGGWIVLNSKKYRAIATREHQKEMNRIRVAKCREKRACNGPVMECNDPVTPSEAEAHTQTEAESDLLPVEKELAANHKSAKKMEEAHVAEIYEAYPKKASRKDAEKAIRKALMEVGFDDLLSKVKAYAEARKGQDAQFTPYPATWFNAAKYDDDPTTWKHNGNSGSGSGYHRPSVADERNSHIGGQEIWEATSGKRALEEGKGFGLE